MINKAREFANKAHAQQRYGDLPYMAHVEAVAALLKPFGQDAMVVGYLHDVLEDTNTNIKELEAEFGAHIAKCVALLKDDPSKSRRDRKRDACARLCRVTGKEELALIVSAADRLANMQACIAAGDVKRLKMYLKEWDDFEAAVYRKGLCDGLWIALARATEEGTAIVEKRTA
jgi:(p)ppGpp synthase/HD superfamily hydrolase